jgi:hypothetical protein
MSISGTQQWPEGKYKGSLNLLNKSITISQSNDTNDQLRFSAPTKVGELQMYERNNGERIVS